MLLKHGSIKIICMDKTKLEEVGENILRQEFPFDCIINKMDFVPIDDIHYHLHYEVE